jgi:hypothetical protein
MERVSIREFSRIVGVSDTAVRKHMVKGLFSFVGKDEVNGRPYLDREPALKEWTDAGLTINNKETKHAEEIKQEPEPEQVPEQKPEPEPVKKVIQHKYSRQNVESIPTKSESDRKQAFYKAEMERIKFEEKSGTLVSRRDVEAKLFSLGQMLSRNLDSWAIKVAQGLPGKYDDNYKILSAEAHSVKLQLIDNIEVLFEKNGGEDDAE